MQISKMERNVFDMNAIFTRTSVSSYEERPVEAEKIDIHKSAHVNAPIIEEFPVTLDVPRPAHHAKRDNAS
ncbi:hypothetical protein SAMN05216583_12728 [Selenomonas sp. KH1T6]|nr:hypothetical protein SAMN05216583_12728 [Selenomonas ruminantium]